MVAGSVPKAWHLALQVKVSSSGAEEVAEGGLSKLCCRHPGRCHNEQRGDSGRRSREGLGDNEEPGGCWGAEGREIRHKLKCFTL